LEEKKARPIPNPLWHRIHDKIQYEVHHNDDETGSCEDKYADITFIPIGTRNNVISQSIHFQIEPHHRMIWHKMDLNACFEEEAE
jgi:hypothetical protein